ncbi:uncharacterized protein B0H18DRAFT_1023881 [Fomitopsis serialis]|uniref:uncharacterized protein n=1 Tax=Fomitopsis serialis TaxID=139415 RepID=UPI002008B802|nr:uncharacterized protein B0H18DRAFT_1023881 [Neoantrodia serialis]KAH9920430.1 hypothetical protein B0H18DRAFT_1023881 [Neoantrodia serialis]
MGVLLDHSPSPSSCDTQGKPRKFRSTGRITGANSVKHRERVPVQQQRRAPYSGGQNTQTAHSR